MSEHLHIRDKLRAERDRSGGATLATDWIVHFSRTEVLELADWLTDAADDDSADEDDEAPVRRVRVGRDPIAHAGGCHDDCLCVVYMTPADSQPETGVSQPTELD